MMVTGLAMTEAPSLTAVMTAILACVCLILLFSRLGRPSNLPPGPWAWPLLGNLPNLITPGCEPHEAFLRLSKQYGPVLSLTLMGKRIVVLHGYEAIHEAFSNPLLNDRPTTKMLKGRGTGVTVASGETWRAQRSLVLRFMRDFSIGKAGFEGAITQEIHSLVEEFEKLKGDPVTPTLFLHNAVANIICSVVYGTRYDYDDPKFSKLLRMLMRTNELLGSGAAFLYMPFAHLISGIVPPLRELAKNFQIAHDFSVEALNEHCSDVHGSGPPRDFMDLCLQSDSNVRIEDIVTTSGELLSVGTETTATTILWSLLYMTAYPDIQARVQRELDLVVGREDLPKLADKPRLPYTEATMMEVQRISTVTPLGVPHQAGQDTTLMGFNIPTGTVIVPNFWALGRDPEVWPEPHLFKPERFLDDDGRVTKKEEFIPFSVGRRVCLGEPLAKMELFLFFACLLHRFTFKKPDSAPPVSFESKTGINHCPMPFEVCAVPRC